MHGTIERPAGLRRSRPAPRAPGRGPRAGEDPARGGGAAGPVMTWLRGGGLSTLVLALPLLLVFGLFSWWPVLRSAVMSVQHTNLVQPATFVGLDNFRPVLADPLLGTAIRNTCW